MRSLQLSSALLLALSPSFAHATDTDEPGSASGHAAPALSSATSGLKRLLALVRPKPKAHAELVAPRPQLASAGSLGQTLLGKVRAAKEQLLGRRTNLAPLPEQNVPVASAMGSRMPTLEAPPKPSHQLDLIAKALETLAHRQWRIPAIPGRVVSTTERGGRSSEGSVQPALLAASLTLASQALHVGVRVCESSNAGAPEIERRGGCTLATYGL